MKITKFEITFTNTTPASKLQEGYLHLKTYEAIITVIEIRQRKDGSQKIHVENIPIPDSAKPFVRPERDFYTRTEHRIPGFVEWTRNFPQRIRCKYPYGQVFFKVFEGEEKKKGKTTFDGDPSFQQCMQKWQQVEMASRLEQFTLDELEDIVSMCKTDREIEEDKARDFPTEDKKDEKEEKKDEKISRQDITPLNISRLILKYRLEDEDEYFQKLVAKNPDVGFDEFHMSDFYVGLIQKYEKDAEFQFMILEELHKKKRLSWELLSYASYVNFKKYSTILPRSDETDDRSREVLVSLLRDAEEHTSDKARVEDIRKRIALINSD